ncbi:MAG TPA: DUF1697 domain-containing protein [Thermoplasmata archaeon]|nr:DUF1697 domain-containing protein [Thermoplasmata archaeon]
MSTRTFVGLLRAVNLGGGTTLPMADLRATLERCGLERVETLLQSGNALFDTTVEAASTLEPRLTEAIVRASGVRTQLLLRSGDEWRSIIRRNPFTREARSDPARLVVTVLQDAPAPSAWAHLREAIPGPERIEGIGREAYVVYPNGIGRSRLTAAFIERLLGTVGTSRNWNTVIRIGDRLTARTAG